MIMTQLDVWTWGLAIGGLWSLGVFLLGILATTWDRGRRIVELFSVVYLGYRVGFVGSLFGAFWAFIDGGMTGLLIAWLINRLIL